MLEHILLDLDSTLICSIPTSSKDSDQYKHVQHLESHVMDQVYTIFERPHLQKFLDHVFKNYKVSIFTASSKNYCLYIVQKFILKPGRKLEYIFFSYHCNLSKNRYKGNHKRLALLSHDFQLASIFPIPGSVLVDDLEDWSKDQKDLVMIIKAYELSDPNAHEDNELLNMIKTLDSVATTTTTVVAN